MYIDTNYKCILIANNTSRCWSTIVLNNNYYYYYNLYKSDEVNVVKLVHATIF